MKKGIAVALIFALCLPIAGCSPMHMVENLAYVLILGVDLNAPDEYELTIQAPKIGSGGAGGSSGSGEGKSEYYIASAKGRTFTDALNALMLTVSRNVSLTHIKLILFSEALAHSTACPAVMEEIMGTYRLYTAAYFAVCLGSAKEFVKTQKLTIGTRISVGLTALIQHASSLGEIPRTTVADAYYQATSLYSDPVLILSGLSESSNAPPSEQAGASDPKTLPSEAESKNVYLGAALMRDGRMVGTATGFETVFLNVLRGDINGFSYVCDGLGVQLMLRNKPSIHVDASAERAKIALDMRMSVLPVTQMPDLKRLEGELEAAFIQVIEKCQSLRTEPFGIAGIAARGFLSLADWGEYDWRARFADAEISVTLQVEKAEA